MGKYFFEDTPNNFTDYCNRNNLEMLIGNYSADFLHGLSVIYSASAISKLKKIQLPFPQTKEKSEASLGEYAFSQILKYINISFSHIPGGIFKFLLHSNSNERDHLYWTANSYMYKKEFKNSLEYYLKYLQYCKRENFRRDLLVAYYNVSYDYLLLKDYSNAFLYIKECLKIDPNFERAIALLRNIGSALNV